MRQSKMAASQWRKVRSKAIPVTVLAARGLTKYGRFRKQHFNEFLSFTFTFLGIFLSCCSQILEQVWGYNSCLCRSNSGLSSSVTIRGRHSKRIGMRTSRKGLREYCKPLGGDSGHTGNPFFKK